LTWDERRKALIDALQAGGTVVLPLVVSAHAPSDLPAGVKLLTPGRIGQDLASL